MSEVNLDEPGFKAKGATTSPPPSSDSSVDNPEARRKCIACPRRMSKKTGDRHTLCVACRGFDCDLESRCEECIAWLEEEGRSYAKYRKSLKSKEPSKSKPSAPPPPPADAVPSSQPLARADMQSQVDSLNASVSSLVENLSARLDALAASLLSPNLSQLSSQTRLGPDIGQPQPGVTTGTRRTFQALGVADRTSGVHCPYVYVDQDVRAPPPEQSGPSAAPQPHAAPSAAPPPSASFVPPQPPPRYGDPPPQPSTLGWVPSGPPPSRAARGSSSESEASEAESDVSGRDSASSRLADLIYEVCPHSHPLFDAARPPRCGFED